MLRTSLSAVFLFALAACKPGSSDLLEPEPTPSDGDPGAQPVASTAPSPIEVYERLERRIHEGTATRADRETAYAAVEGVAPDMAEVAFARAAIAGRLAEDRGLRGLALVKEAERLASKSIEIDPAWRGGAARRLLGTLYVLAGQHTEHGDSEEGLELLEELTEEFPDEPLNHLRLAEGYLALDDPDPALEHLCFVRAHADGLQAGDRRLLEQLVSQVGGEGALGC